MKVITAPAKRGAPRKEREAPDPWAEVRKLKRIAAVGPDGDPALANTPLGILQARGMIEVCERAAGEEYRRLYARSLGVGPEFGLDPGGNGTGDEALERITELYNEMTRHLLNLGREVWFQVLCVAVHEERPLWMRRAICTPHKHIWRLHKHHIDFINLHSGLKALTGGGKRSKRPIGNCN